LSLVFSFVIDPPSTPVAKETGLGRRHYSLILSVLQQEEVNASAFDRAGAHCN
jgi:hypothetical protein